MLENNKNINLFDFTVDENYCNEWGDLFKCMACCLLSFNIMTFFIGKSYYIELMFKFLPLFFSLIFLYMGAYIKNQEIRISSVDLTWLIFFIFILGRIKSLHSSNLVFIFYMIFCMSIIVLYKEKIELYIMPIKIIQYIGVFYAISVYIQAINPDLFFNYLDFAAIQEDQILNFSEKVVAIENAIYVSGIPQDVAYSAAYISFSIGSTLCFKSKTTIGKNINFIMIIMLSIALLLTTKRAHLLFTIVCVTLIYFLVNENKNIFNMLKKISLFSFLIVCSFMFYLYLFPEAGIVSRFWDTYEAFVYGDDITSGRILLYATAWNLFLSNPLAGVGWKRYTIAGNEDMSAHSNYLQILSETGIFGLILFVTALLVTWILTVRKLKKSTVNNLSSSQIPILAFSLYIQTFFLIF